jgi:hypothetical protein
MNGKLASVPVHARVTTGKGLFAAILKALDIDLQEFIDSL